MTRLVHVTTIPDALAFLEGQIAYMKNRGFEIEAISSPAPKLADFGRREGVVTHGLVMHRRVTPIQDFLTVCQMAVLLRRIKPHIVHAHTPKGGLLGMIAATAAGIPVRVYHMRGLPMMSATGYRRWLLSETERLSCRLATRVICQSESLRTFAVDSGFCRAEHSEVLASGSNGVDSVGRFNPDRLEPQTRSLVRRSLRIPEESIVFGFIGRLVRDKGIRELAYAWAIVREQFPDAILIVAGDFEPQDPVPKTSRRILEGDTRVRLTGFHSDAPTLYAAMDVLVLPTYREGFPNVVLEAASMKLPVVATRIPGCIDGVIDGETGLLVPPGDANALAQALCCYAKDADLRTRHGRTGRERVMKDFTRERVWEALEKLYRAQLREHEVSC